ncbi:MAG: hypothetical protein F4Y27_10770 [Acidimicrobiaceae bacterium]|nr:hypothetical protein [Acidimicrobiaceae bacterium]MYA75148.1 hypothetical protein [Acidimicrobiaceae bacterium]MYC43379.1 hypothetical protein [Acidimicrobiaceae bacterium]MYH88261.1 hypothetical protein [Acidimicrobiaceae bacterium]
MPRLSEYEREQRSRALLDLDQALKDRHQIECNVTRCIEAAVAAVVPVRRVRAAHRTDAGLWPTDTATTAASLDAGRRRAPETCSRLAVPHGLIEAFLAGLVADGGPSLRCPSANRYSPEHG